MTTPVAAARDPRFSDGFLVLVGRVVLDVFKPFGVFRVYGKFDRKRRAVTFVVDHRGSMVSFSIVFIYGKSKLTPSWAERKAVSGAKSLARAISEYSRRVPGTLKLSSWQTIVVHFNRSTRGARMLEFSYNDARRRLEVEVNKIVAESVDRHKVRVNMGQVDPLLDDDEPRSRPRNSIWFIDASPKNLDTLARKVKWVLLQVLRSLKNLFTRKLAKLQRIVDALEGQAFEYRVYSSDGCIPKWLDRKIEWYRTVLDDTRRLLARIRAVEGLLLEIPAEELLANM